MMIQLESIPADIQPYYHKLCNILKSYESLVIAYSGGVDSAFLAFVAKDALEDRMIAVLGISPSLAKREEAQALEFLEQYDIPHTCVQTDELDISGYHVNGPDRCYYCKGELFNKLEHFAEEQDYKRIAHGANVDDKADYRPGSKAAAENNVAAPLIDAGFTKDMIRRTASALGLVLWDKPSAPCLASRIPYHMSVTTDKLAQIEQAENALKDMGFPICRVRHHGDIARIEIPEQDLPRLFDKDALIKLNGRIKQAGFKYVTVDMEGFRSGRLNDPLQEAD
jgi:uncharacterized protein